MVSDKIGVETSFSCTCFSSSRWGRYL